MRTLYYDCFSGISGDMFLGALLDLGLDEAHLRKELSKLGLDGEFTLSVTRGLKKGISGTKVKVKLCTKWQTRPSHHHVHRTYGDIEALIAQSGLSAGVKKCSLEMFWALAVAEGAIHGKEPREVGFHEVGAVDSIVDIVGAAIGLEALHVTRCLASRVELGGGFVRCAHGLIPVPAPATAALLKGVPVSFGRVESEATTPTGAVIVKTTVGSFTPEPAMRIDAIGYGLGERDFNIPNVLRLFLGDA